MIAPLKIADDYWQNFEIEKEDIEFIFNILLEKETPLTTKKIFFELINHRINFKIKELHEKKSKQGNIYLPKNEYQIGEDLVFTAFDSHTGKIESIRKGRNPDYPDLKVIEVQMESGEKRSFASGIEDHSLNQVMEIFENDPNLDPEYVEEKFGEEIRAKLNKSLEENEDLVRIAGNWFPRSLLVDVSVGHLNIAEAVLEEADGGPMGTLDLMEQVELKSDANQKLLEFSFDLALQEDNRFDEVGPAGETLWFLYEMEPENVKQVPVYLKYNLEKATHDGLEKYLELFEGNVFDELDAWDSSIKSESKISISLLFPHWRSGTLPLSRSLQEMFPTAYEAPRVKFTFVDKSGKESFSGWEVRSHKYIFGLKAWYKQNEFMPGSLITVEKGKKPGEILVSFQKSRQNKEWLKTILVGSDQGIVFAMLKHPISTDFNERMALAIPDVDALDEIWAKNVYGKEEMGKTVMRIMRELSKLNPQGQVHAQELYAALNLIRRCPPSLVLESLLNNESISHLGDLYFRIEE